MRILDGVDFIARQFRHGAASPLTCAARAVLAHCLGRPAERESRQPLADCCVTGNMDLPGRQYPGESLAKPSEPKRKKRNGGTTTSRMRDVARKAGVSVMTVSRALNDPDKVSKEMRLKVRAVVDEIGYVPNRLARSLSSNCSNLIGLIVPSIRTSLFAETIKSISDVDSAYGYRLKLSNSGHRDD